MFLHKYRVSKKNFKEYSNAEFFEILFTNDHKSFKNSTKRFLHFMYNDLHAFIPAVALKL